MKARLLNVASRPALLILAPVCLTLLAGSLVQASQSQSRGPFKWWQVHRQALALTADQSTRLEEIYQTFARDPKVQELKQQLDKHEEKLSKMVKAGVADEAAVAALVDRVEAARSELSKNRTLMLYRMYRVLSDEQRTKLRALHEEWERQRDKGRRSGSMHQR
jgi:Spy/CpxP family protein refolding chaperone